MKGRLFIIYSGFWDNRVIIVNLLELLIYLWSNRMVIVRIIYSRINYFESRYLYSSTASILCIFEMNLFHHFLLSYYLCPFFYYLTHYYQSSLLLFYKSSLFLFSRIEYFHPIITQPSKNLLLIIKNHPYAAILTQNAHLAACQIRRVHYDPHTQ